MATRPYCIVKREDGRYVIAHAETFEVLDTAQGYGYTTRQKAEKAAWYQFNGGKARRHALQQAAAAFWRQHHDFAVAVQEYYETWWKEIARGETDPAVDLAALAQAMGVDGFQRVYLEYS